MKKVLLLLMAIAITSLAASAATNYQINIAGTEVTSDNASHIGPSSSNDITSGYAVYNASTNTLTCYSLKIYRTGNDNYGIHNRSCNDLTIVFKGYCQVATADHALNLARSTTLIADEGSTLDAFTGGSSHALNLGSYTYFIEGSGNIYLNGKNAIHGNGSGSTTVKFQGAKVSTESNLGSNSKNHALESFKAVFNEGADLIINSNGSYTSVNNVSMYFYGKETVLSPYGAYYSNSAIYSSSGSQITSQDIYISDQYVAKLSSDYFPDANFRGYLQRVLFPKGYITESDVNATTSMNASSEYISSLQGIGYFSKLVNFSCEENILTSLPSLPSTLKYLNCRNNNLTSLPSLPSGLTSLICDQNQLTALPTMPSTLQTLECENNKLTSLNLTGCSALTYLSCHNNQITSFTSLPTTLQTIYCNDNKLSGGTFDVSGRSALKILDIRNNPNFSGLKCNNCSLTSLSVSGCTGLTKLVCNHNQLTSLSLTGCTALNYFDCEYNKLTSVSISNNTALKEVYLNHNEISTAPAFSSGNLSTLEILGLSDNKLTSFGAQNFTKLWALGLSDNPNLTTVIVTNNSALKNLYVANCTALTSLDCGYNQLTSLDVSGLSNLTELNCRTNKLTSLNLSNKTKLTSLNAGYNQLTSLNVQGCSSLNYLMLESNKLTSLSVQGCNALRTINCCLNKISASGANTLINSLCTIPSGSQGALRYIYPGYSSGSYVENNVNLTDAQVRSARNKRWIPYKFTGSGWVEIPINTAVPGDVNGDGTVTAADVTALYDVLLNNDYTNVVNGDQTGDGQITAADVTAVYSILLGE